MNDMNQMNIATIDLNLLKVFEALHEESSASRAALRLGVTQSAVSAALRRLREVYGDAVHTVDVERYVEFYGEAHGARLFRKVAPWYAKRFGPSKPFKRAIITIESRADFEAAIAEYLAWRAQFCDERGELLEKFQPAPMVASFMREPGEAGVFERDAIPVPKGPVDTW